MGAIVERVTIRFSEVLVFLGLAKVTTAIVVVSANPPASTTFATAINGTRATFAGGGSPTPASVAAGLVAAINASGVLGPLVTAADLGGGRYSIVTDVAGSSFELIPDAYQDIEPAATAIDQTLASFITVAKEIADEYCGNPFATFEENADGTYIYDETGAPILVAELDIPEAVRTGVLQIISLLFNEYRKISGAGGILGSGAVAGPVSSRAAGDLSVSYASDVATTPTASQIDIVAGAIGAALPRFVRSILDLYRFTPGA